MAPEWFVYRVVEQQQDSKYVCRQVKVHGAEKAAKEVPDDGKVSEDYRIKFS
jgi:hypothetical protein